MDPSIEKEQILEQQQFAEIQDLDAFLFFSEFEDTCLPPYYVRDMGANNATNNVEIEAHLVGEKEKTWSPSMLVCPLCGSETTNESYPEEMLDEEVKIKDTNGKFDGSSSSSTEGIVAFQMQTILYQDVSFEETSHNRNGSDSSTGRLDSAQVRQIPENGMAIEETNNNVYASSSSTERMVGSLMVHGGYIGVSNEGKATGVAGNTKTWTRRPRCKKGSPETARQKQLYKIRNREPAARSFAQKQAYIRNLERQILTLQKENTFGRNVLKFLESHPVSPTAQRRLRRTPSASI